MYFSSSQASRLLPIPAGPVMETNRARGSRPVVASSSLSSRSSSSRPANGGSGRSLRPWPPRCATTRTARQAATGAALPLRIWSPASSNAIDALRGAHRRLADENATGGATDWIRAAVLTRSPATMPWFVGAHGHGGLTGQDTRAGLDAAAERRTASTSSSAARTARSASSSRAVGAPQTAITASPMNFSTRPPYSSMTSRAIAK